MCLVKKPVLFLYIELTGIAGRLPAQSFQNIECFFLTSNLLKKTEKVLIQPIEASQQWRIVCPSL
jgi:hypothetical protein